MNDETRQPLDIAELNGRQAVFRILAHTKKPMKQRDVLKWLENHGQRSLTKGQIVGAFKKLHSDNIVEKTERGTYRIRSNVQPRDETQSNPIPK